MRMLFGYGKQEEWRELFFLFFCRADIPSQKRKFFIMTIPLSHVILDSLRISHHNYQKITKINSEINQKYQKRLKKEEKKSKKNNNIKQKSHTLYDANMLQLFG